MSEETRNTSQQSSNSTPEVSGGQGEERKFTQEEVNKIVSERLAREREKATPSEADQREKALAAREAALACKEYSAPRDTRRRCWRCWTRLTPKNSRPR